MTARVLNEIFFKNCVYVCSVSAPKANKGPRFTKLDVFFTFLSVVTFFSDIATDVIVVSQYALAKQWMYAGMTLFFVLMPSVVVNICSLRWHIHDQRVSKMIWVANVMQFGVLHRYWLCLRAGFKAERTRDADDFRELYQHQSDLCMLRLFDSFLESAPQLVLQLYIMVNNEEWNPWTGVSALLSLLSLGWGIAAYGKAMRLHRAEKQQLSWTGLVLQTLWRFGTMTSRVTAMVLLACVCGAWSLAILGVHWALMTSWLVWQKTDFCPSRCEELAYNAIVGAIYTFCFFNVRDGRSRGRVVSFYTFIGLQNVAFLVAYCIAWSEADDLHAITATAVVLGSLGIGMYCMALYYRFFHPSGPIYLCGSHGSSSFHHTEHLETQKPNTAHGDEPTPRSKPRPAATVSASHSFRTLKYVNCTQQMTSTPCHLDARATSPTSSDDSTISPCDGDTHFDAACTDAKACGESTLFCATTMDNKNPPCETSHSRLHHLGTTQSFLESIANPREASKVRFDLRDCSLDESHHRWRSEECSFADRGSDSYYDMYPGRADFFDVTRDRIASRHHVVNYNFRPFVANAELGYFFRRHCSCLVLFECLPELSGFESSLSPTDSAADTVKKALQSVNSTPNMRLGQSQDECSQVSAGSWSMHNFLVMAPAFSESGASELVSGSATLLI